MENVLVDIRNENEYIKGYFEGQDTVSIDDLLGAIEDLMSEVDHLEEEIEDIKQDIEDNYKPIPKSEQYGISERDFY